MAGRAVAKLALDQPTARNVAAGWTSMRDRLKKAQKQDYQEQGKANMEKNGRSAMRTDHFTGKMDTVEEVTLDRAQCLISHLQLTRHCNASAP
ncbi:hypothetical protein [Stenotrophomonas sp. CFBP 13718]|uniref:hypothetical protein n=1 Tax=Stenotrophomonas sp. CFBP 13718 TaxID=2775304 RepID=UPI00177EA446|nr:hypothetical protein [Stenotrophomonas sp. CFBP 13718]MBD8694636.1 hypothetical protein [Stenotrophomonas sp. CFBP 13718]